MECNIVSIWASFDWNVSTDRTTKRGDLFNLLKTSYMRAKLISCFVNSGRERGFGWYRIMLKKINHLDKIFCF